MCKTGKLSECFFFCFHVHRFTKTKLKKSSFPLIVRFKDVLNHRPTCISCKHHLEIILHYLNILRVQCKNVTGWQSGAVVRASDFGPRGPWFEPRPVHISLWP